MKEITEFKKTWIAEPKALGGGCYVLIPRFLKDKKVRITVEYPA